MSIDYEKLLSVKDELMEVAEKGMRSTALSFLRNVILASPRDKGTFQANWAVALSASDYAINERLTSANAAIKRGSSELKRFEFTGSNAIYITNPMPYGQRLNNGYAKQAPKFFVEIAARNAGIDIKDGDVNV